MNTRRLFSVFHCIRRAGDVDLGLRARCGPGHAGPRAYAATRCRAYAATRCRADAAIGCCAH